MSTAESVDPLTLKHEDLSLVVEPLVDSISELVLSAVTASFQNVQALCEAIAERTNKLVVIAQQVAIGSTDHETQLEVAGAINRLAASIEGLVISFTDILRTNNDKTQEGFAAAAKEVGEAINLLVQSTDTTSQHKLLAVINETYQSVQQVENAALNAKENLLKSAQLLVERTVRLIKVAATAASTTADEKKKNLLLDGASKIKVGSPALIQSAKSLLERPFDATCKADLSAKAKNLYVTLEELRNVAKLNPAYFGKVAETYEYVKKLIEAARQLEVAATDLYNVTHSTSATPQQFIESAKATATKALALVEQVENAMKLEKDSIKRELMRDAVVELREVSQAVLIAARAYKQNPDDPAAKAKFEEEHARLERAIKRVVQLTNGELYEESPRGRLRACADALEISANRVVKISTTNPAEAIQESEVVASIAAQLAQQTEAYANGLTDPDQKKNLLADARDLRAAPQRFTTAVQRIAANPNDKASQVELGEAHKSLLDKINGIRQEAGIVSENVPQTLSFELESGKSAEAQLATAAKEEAIAAFQLVTEAEKIISRTVDPLKKQKLQAAVADVKLHAQSVLDNAELVSKKPNDPAAQQKLATAQKDLGSAIQRVVQLSEDKDTDVADAMAELKLDTDPKQSVGSEASVLSAAQSVLDDILKSFSNSTLNPQQVIANAKELSAKAGELAKQLRDLAEKTTDPAYKEKLINAAKIIKDSSIQVKILSAVRAAGGEDKSNSVGMAIKGLQANIQEVVKDVQAQAIKNRFRATVQRTIAVNKVVSVWKKKALK